MSLAKVLALVGKEDHTPDYNVFILNILYLDLAMIELLSAKKVKLRAGSITRKISSSSMRCKAQFLLISISEIRSRVLSTRSERRDN